MAHGVIPPFCGMLVCEAFVDELCSSEAPHRDVVLLGNASNEVQVPQEIVEAYHEILQASYWRYLASGSCDLRDETGRFSRDAQQVLTLLIGAALDIDPAVDCLRSIAPMLRGEADGSWSVMVNGGLRSKIQMVEEQLGELVKEGAKDVYTHAPHDGGFERLEWALNS